MKYIIEPQNEPYGEGNGWDVCDEKDAKVWAVIDPDETIGWVVEAFETRAEAERYIANSRE